MNNEPATPAAKLGTTTHLSPLLRKARGLGLQLPDDLLRLAAARGCNYYAVSTGPLPQAGVPLSNEELAVALLSPALPASPESIRVGAAVLSGRDVDASRLVALAEQEECDGLLRYIAECGRRYEPDGAFWNQLLGLLSQAVIPGRPLPHPTRFIEMTGLIRGRQGLFTRWIRPVPAGA